MNNVPAQYLEEVARILMAVRYTGMSQQEAFDTIADMLEEQFKRGKENS